MIRILIVFFVFFIAQVAYALDVVYPKKNNVVINSSSTFFIGSADPKKDLTVNGVKVKVHPSGGFAYSIPLSTGKNTFSIVSGEDKLIYDIIRPAPQNSPAKAPAQKKEYEDLKYALVVKENAPLRSTPISSGINRIAHLQKNMPLVLDGEKGNFYSVILGNTRVGWIDKSDVKFTDSGLSLAELKGYDAMDTPEFSIYVFHLSKMVPFELVEGNPFVVKLFNVENNPENTYKFTAPVNKLFGYSARFSGTDFILKIRKAPPISQSTPLRGLNIAIDAGHGGNEAGAVGCLGHLEKDLNLEFAKFLEQELKHRGANVYMTRKSDEFVGLKERVDLANEADSVVLLSLHGNALPDSADPITNNGTEIYYYYNQAKPLADVLLKEITTKTGMNDHKVRQGSLALVRNTNALSVLIEIGFLINPSDNAKMINKDFQKKTAEAIADGLEKFFKN